MSRNFYITTIKFFDAKQLKHIGQIAKEKKGYEVQIDEHTKQSKYGFRHQGEMCSFFDRFLDEGLGDIIHIWNEKGTKGSR